MSRKIKKRPPSPIKQASPADGNTLQEAIRLHHEGRLDEAELLYHKSLTAQPKQADTLTLLATLCQQKGNFRQAATLLQKAIGLQGGRADYYSNLGSAQRSLGDTDKAIASFRKALSLQPSHLESQFNLALTQLERGDLTAAAAGFQKILQTKPAFIPAHEMLARCLMEQGLLTEARSCFQEIVRLDPQHSVAFCEIGNILQAQDKSAEAISAYEQALAITPDYAVAHNNLGNTLVKQGELHAAMARYQDAIRYNPDLGEAHVNLSWTYKEHGMIAADVACLQRFLERHPEECRAHSDMLFSMNYDPAYSPGQLYTAAQAWWQRHAPGARSSFTRPIRLAGQKLRIGFLSPDFREHPVGTFLLPLFKAIGAQEASLHCYAEMHDQQMDAVSNSLHSLATSWQSTVGLSALEAARRIQHDQIDILIDLAGHSANNRLDIMALQPAPRQVSWLGYVNTTGLPVIDYRLTDAVADPPGTEAYYSETLLRLPDAFFCYEPPGQVPEVGPLPALVNGRITFGSLNNPAKITEEVISLWAQVILQTPDSRLIMVGSPFADEFIKDRYLGQFSACGVSPERIELLPTLPMQDYLQLYNRIDIALDPFPHNGHTITCHTLWMGVPVITLAGNRYAARMGASVLTASGIPELIAHTSDQYLQIAADLSNNIDYLSTLRHTMRKRLLQSTMCDTSRFAKNFLQAMHTIQESL